jgi:hypothetical protein
MAIELFSTVTEFPLAIMIASVAIGVMIALMRFRKFVRSIHHEYICQ